MESKIILAVNEMENASYTQLSEVLEHYSKQEALDIWLRYEGIVGYSSQILGVLNAMDIDTEW